MESIRRRLRCARRRQGIHHRISFMILITLMLTCTNQTMCLEMLGHKQGRPIILYNVKYIYKLKG